MTFPSQLSWLRGHIGHSLPSLLPGPSADSLAITPPPEHAGCSARSLTKRGRLWHNKMSKTSPLSLRDPCYPLPFRNDPNPLLICL